MFYSEALGVLLFSIIFTSFNVIVFSNAFVGGMLRCVFTVQRYEYFFTIDDIFFLEGEGGVAEMGGTKVVVLLLTVFLFPSIDNAILLFLTAEHIYASVFSIRLSSC